MKLEEISSPQWPTDVDEVDVECPHCQATNPVQIVEVRESRLRGRLDICTACDRDFIIELSETGADVFKAVDPLSAKAN